MESMNSGGLWTVLLILVPLLLAYHGATRIVWALAGAATLAAFTLYAAVPWWVLLLVWLIYLGPFLVFALPQVRRRLLSDRVHALFQESMPPISETEREALEAGTTWWDAELFTGRPRWRRLVAHPRAQLSEEERAFIDGPVEELCAMVNDWEVNDERMDLPPEAWRFIRENRFFGMIIPKRYGGLEFSQFGHAAVVMRLASRSISTALTVMIPNSVGPAKLLLKYGTEAQREHYLPRLARGEEIPCFALTGPDAGSDAGAMKDTGVVCRGQWQGEEVLGVRLDFEKRYITLGPVATVLGVAFKLRDPDRLLGDEEEPGISLALVPADLPGVENGRRHDPLRMAFMNGPVSGRGVFVPLEQLIGGAEYAGKGWRMLMESLTDGRAISLPALSAGTAKLAARTTGAYAGIRRQFKMPIAAFEGVQEALARIAGHTYSIDAARLVTLAALDAGHKPSVISAIVKYNLTERARTVVDDAMQVHGGAGICLGPHNVIGQYTRFPNIAATVEGANILTRSLITFGQGAIRCHPFLLEELSAASDPDADAGRRRFDRLVVRHIAFSVRNALRAFWLALTGSRLSLAPVRTGQAARWFRRMSRMSAAFAFTSDILLLSLRGGLKRRERISARMADVLSQLYLGSCVLKHYLDGPDHAGERPLMDWAMADAMHRAEEAFFELYDNLPRWQAWFLRLVCFPLGRSHRRPTDTLDASLAAMLSAPGSARDRLTAGMHIPADPGDQVRRLDDALDRTVRTAPYERKLRDARMMRLVEGRDIEEQLASAVDNRVISEDEADELMAAEEARRIALAVDDFPMDRGRR